MSLARRLGFVRGERGIGLIEIAVSMSILGVAGGLMMTGVFQTYSFQRNWQYEVAAQQELRRAGSWLSVDATNAETISAVDGAPATSTLALYWTDVSGVPHAAAYSVNGTNLVRRHDGIDATIARRVASAQFSRVGSVLVFYLEILTRETATVNSTLQTYMRAIQ